VNEIRVFRCIVAALAIVGAASRLHAQEFPIRRWLVRGPIPADTGAAGVLRDYLGGEAAVRPDSGQAVAGGPFFPADADSLGHIDFNRVLPDTRDWSAAYAHAYVWAPRELTALLVMDSDDDLVGWLNGQRVWLHIVPRGVGRGSDTTVVRLASGWNSLLLKVINRGGGFDVLGRLAPAPGERSLDGVRSQVARPAELAGGHNLPSTTITVSQLRVASAPIWNGAALEMGATLRVSAWGRDTLGGVVTRLEQGTARWAGDSLGAVAPGTSRVIAFRPTFDELRRAALGRAPLSATIAWSGGTRAASLGVDADLLLRLIGGRIALGSWLVDSSAQGRRIQTRLIVPAAFAGEAADLLAAEFGPNATYTIGARRAVWRAGVLELCAPCRAGDTLDIAIALEPGRALWSFPAARLHEIGYREYADGYDYARVLAGRAPEILRPEAREWLAALGEGPGLAPLRARYGAAYAPLVAGLRRDTLHLVGNSHIDAAWLWPWTETIDVIRNTWRSSLRIGSAFPGYVFAASAAAYFDAMDQLEPALADSLARAVADGTFALVGGWWVEPDQNLPSGESLARQGLYGQRYFQRRFGQRAHVAWTPDSFGYPWTLPQIYRLAGFDAFVTQKIRWNDSTRLPYNAFWWEGRDGSRIFTYNPYGYDHDLEPQRLVQDRLNDRQRPGTSNHMLVLYGVGDHGGGPTMEMLQRAEDLARVPAFPVLRYDSPDSAFAQMRRSRPDTAFPVWRDELYLEYHRGTYTTQARQKASLRASETSLRTAEALATFDTAAYPRARLEGAWRRVLFNEFHDILPGSGIRRIYLDADANYDSARSSMDSVSGAAFAGLRARLDTRLPARREGVPVVVFNPLPWPRSGYVTAGGGSSPGLWVRDVPPLGARVVWVDSAHGAAVFDEHGRDIASGLEAPQIGATWMENAFLRVELDTATGTITRIYDKRAGREVLTPGGRGNVLELFGDRPRSWDAWDIGYTGERWEIDSVVGIRRLLGGGSARVVVTRRFGPSTFEQELVLDRSSAYLDVRNRMDWRGRRQLVKVGFTLATAPDSLTCEIPYGTIGRAGRPRTQAERAKYEFPCQRWVDVSDSTGGAGFFTDSKYGWDYHGNVLRLSLLRAPIWPDSLADRGAHEFRFAIYPHAGDWRAAHTERRATEYNTPLVSAPEGPHPGPLGRAVSFASVDAPNVELTWVKRAEDSEALVLRLVEWHGRPGTATITLRGRVTAARRANLIEDPGESLSVRGNTVRITLRPYEIATILVDMAR
jgi:alpha-mannosidase